MCYVKKLWCFSISYKYVHLFKKKELGHFLKVDLTQISVCSPLKPASQVLAFTRSSSLLLIIQSVLHGRVYHGFIIFKGVFETPFFLIFVVTSDPPYAAPGIQTTLTWLLWHFHFHWSLTFLHIPMKILGRSFFWLSAEDWVIFLSDPSGLKAVCDQCLQCSGVKKT